MYLTDFNYHKPETIEEACKILSESNNAALLAGGTDILVELKKGLKIYDDVVSIKNLSDLIILKKEKENIIIGSAVTHNEIKNSTLIKKYLPALSKAVTTIGTEQIRNTGTIGGNICTAASCCDTAPVLLAYGASLEITSCSNKVTIPIKDFFLEHHKTVLKKGEILTKISIPIPNKSMGVSFIKFGLRDSAAISVTSVSVMLNFKNDICADSRIAIGAVTSAPKLSEKSKDILLELNKQKIVEEDTLNEICKSTVEDALPIDDIRGSADYRRNVVYIITKRAILEAINQINF